MQLYSILQYYKLSSLLLVLFALRRFNIRSVQDLGEPYEYVYSKIKEPYEYEYSRLEKTHEYRYFKIEKLHGYKYPIIKKLDEDI